MDAAAVEGCNEVNWKNRRFSAPHPSTAAAAFVKRSSCESSLNLHIRKGRQTKGISRPDKLRDSDMNGLMVNVIKLFLRKSRFPPLQKNQEKAIYKAIDNFIANFTRKQHFVPVRDQNKKILHYLNSGEILISCKKVLSTDHWFRLFFDFDLHFSFDVDNEELIATISKAFDGFSDFKKVEDN